jgi:hypothetical protein
MNQYLADFYSQLQDRFDADRADMPTSLWVSTNTHLKKKAFSFENYEFQRQIIDDWHKDLSVIKPSQIGLTEIQIRKFLSFAKRNPGTTGIFSSPTDQMRDRTSMTRVKPLLDTEKVFNMDGGVEKLVRRKDLYQIDDSFCYFTGAKENDATSIAADYLFNDEVDLSDQTMISLFQSRLQGSTHRITQRFSTPTFVGYGIDAFYEASDKNEWTYRCPHCTRYQIPIFHPRFLCLPGVPDVEDLTSLDADQVGRIDFNSSFICCEHCRRGINHDPANWSWIAEHPARKTRGYRVRPFGVRLIADPAYVFKQLGQYKATNNLRGFHNTVLGEAFNDSNARLNEAQIRGCMNGSQAVEPSAVDECFIGIDVGLICHVVVGKPGVVFEWRQVPQAELKSTISSLRSKYNIVGGCMDLEPYRPTAEEIRDDTAHIILPVDYSTTNSVQAVTTKTDEFDVFSHLVANRTMAIDTVARMVRKQAVSFVGYGQLEHIIVAQLQDMVRIEVPGEDARWQKLTGNDHFFHALGYLFLAMRTKQVIDFANNSEARFNAFLFGTNLLNSPSGALNSKSRAKANISLGMVA